MLVFATLVGLFPKTLPKTKQIMKESSGDESTEIDEKLKHVNEDVQLKSTSN